MGVKKIQNRIGIGRGCIKMHLTWKHPSQGEREREGGREEGRKVPLKKGEVGRGNEGSFCSSSSPSQSPFDRSKIVEFFHFLPLSPPPLLLPLPSTHHVFISPFPPPFFAAVEKGGGGEGGGEERGGEEEGFSTYLNAN